MTKPLLIFCGRVTKLANVTPQKTKPYLSVKIEGIPETYNGKPYSVKVEAKVYYNAEELAKTLREGMLVSCKGDARAEHFEWNQKHYASLVCERATVTILDDGRGGEEEPPKARQQPLASVATTEPKPFTKPADDEEDVPFRGFLQRIFGMCGVRV